MQQSSHAKLEEKLDAVEDRDRWNVIKIENLRDECKEYEKYCAKIRKENERVKNLIGGIFEEEEE